MALSREGVFVLSSLVALPALADAQTTIAGVVRDSSGGVLPGVLVEASGPALIEKSRRAVTDDAGQYRIVELRPGIYRLLFSRAGFAALTYDGIAVIGSGVLTVHADMRLGAVNDVINVTAEALVLDVQSAGREVVLEARVINEVPAARGYAALLAAIPALQALPANSSPSANAAFFTAHGGPPNEGRVTLDGLPVGAAFNGGGVSSHAYDVSNAQEVQVALSGALGDAEVGGPTVNIVPQTGGNAFHGAAFVAAAGRRAQGRNVDQALAAQGVGAPGVIKLWDASGAAGGPIRRDRLWFFANVRDFGSHTQIPGLYANRYAGDPARWDYAPDPSVPARSATSKTVASVRLTSQLTRRNKVGFFYDSQWNCDQGGLTMAGGCRARGEDWVPGTVFGASFSPEAATNYWDAREVVSQATWSSPVTDRLLLDAGFATFVSRWGWMKQPGAVTNLVQMTTVLPVFRVYRGVDNIFDNTQNPSTWRASATHTTGAHTLKFGYRGAYHVEQTSDFSNDAGYILTDLGFITPGLYAATMRIAPWQQSNRTESHAVYAQDRWTRGRLTLAGALRYDRAWSWFPSEHNGAPQAGIWNASPIAFPATAGVAGYHDITPRGGAAYDVFGNGKTVLKGNVGRYLQSATNQENYAVGNPALDGRNGRRGPNFQTTATRWFVDVNGNHVPDCRMLLNAPNGECVAADLGNFASATALTLVNPSALRGWGVRPYDWQFGVSVLQELAPKTSLEVGWARRDFGNFFVYDNLNVGPGDFTRTTYTAPVNANLPGGGGYAVHYDILSPSASRAIQNRFTSADDYGGWASHWNGVDLAVSSRVRRDLTLQLGSSTGRAIVDYCAAAAKVPELLNPALTNPSASNIYQLAGACRKEESWQTQVRGFVTVIVPRADVLVSGIFRSLPNAIAGAGATPEGNGAGLSANFVAPTGQTVNLLPPGRYFADRINQIDLRVGRILKFAKARATIAADVFNLLNSNTGTAFQQNYGDGMQYRTPTAVLNPRFLRFSLSIDFQ